MKQLLPFWFAPAHQPREGAKVEFQLRPLDMPTFYTLQASRTRRRGAPEWEGISATFEHSVVDWRGLETPFSAAAKRDALADADVDFMIWLAQIAGELYSRAVLKEEERKNS